MRERERERESLFIIAFAHRHIIIVIIQKEKKIVAKAREHQEPFGYQVEIPPDLSRFRYNRKPSDDIVIIRVNCLNKFRVQVLKK